MDQCDLDADPTGGRPPQDSTCGLDEPACHQVVHHLRCRGRATSTHSRRNRVRAWVAASCLAGIEQSEGEGYRGHLEAPSRWSAVGPVTSRCPGARRTRPAAESAAVTAVARRLPNDRLDSIAGVAHGLGVDPGPVPVGVDRRRPVEPLHVAREPRPGIAQQAADALAGGRLGGGRPSSAPRPRRPVVPAARCSAPTAASPAPTLVAGRQVATEVLLDPGPDRADRPDRRAADRGRRSSRSSITSLSRAPPSESASHFSSARSASAHARSSSGRKVLSALRSRRAGDPHLVHARRRCPGAPRRPG